MASGDVSKVNRDPPHGVLQENMKQVDVVNNEELDKDRFQVIYRESSTPGRARRVSCTKRRGSALAALAFSVGRKQQRGASDGSRAALDPGMADKENELRGESRPVVCHNDRAAVLPLNATATPTITEASRMEAASSKYSDFTELSKDHEDVTQVLFERNLRLKVALTLWRKNASELVAYLLRIQDSGVLIDCLPILTSDLQGASSCSSLGCCVDLLQLVRVVLSSKYEAHVAAALLWLQAVIRKWWAELSRAEKRQRGRSSEDRNIEVMKQRLKEVWRDAPPLRSLPGATGDLAKVVESLLSQLP